MKRKQEEKPDSRIAQLEKELTANTVELKRKNRDLEIEASLERVRAVAMGMNQSDDLLSICETMFHELKKLGFDDLRNAMIDIHYEANEYLLNYDYSDNTGKTITTFKYNSHPIVDNLIYHAKQSSEAFTEMVYSGKALGDWRIFRKENGEADDPGIENIEALYYYFYSIGTGAIGISTFSAANPEQLDVLKRFRNVFDLAYRRYTDIQQAESQAHEAQIELGLERVRARAMAMQSSNELAELVTTLFNELSKLHFTLARCLIWIIDAETLSATTWMANPGVDAASYQMKYFDHPYYKGIIRAWKERIPKWAYELKGKEKRDLDDIVFNLPALKDTPEVVKAAMRAIDKAVISFSFSNFGGLQVDGTEPLSEDNLDILARFSKVFDQTYTRFSDLKKAEAQAREALIEGALERVRSRAMAMHKTDELLESAELLPKELTGLGIGSVTVCYVLVNEKDKTGAYYGVNPIDGKIKSQPTIMPHTETKVMRALRASWLKQEPVHFIVLDPKASLVHQTYIAKLIAAQSNAPEFTVEGFLSVSPERVHIYSLNFKQGYLFLVGGAPLAAADIEILIRFTKVFELTYTRFLDLQKAEGQAREGRIELALERVRARTMAMQHSDELAETAYILFQQFRELGENPDQATIGIINEAEGVIEYWVTIYGNQTNRAFKFPIDEPNVTRKIYDAWKAQEKSLVIDLSGQALYDFSKFRESMGGAGYNEAEQRRIINVAFFSKGLINVQSTVTRSVESLRLLERFASVFEGTYTRFLDLKKAEAQAREAQIELALERVRAKTMAMQHSDELLETSQVVFQQLRDLGETADQIGIAIVKEDEGVFDLFATIYGNQMVRVVHPKIDDPFVMGRVYKNWKAHKKSFIVELGGEELRRYNILRNQLGGQNYYNENVGADDRWIVNAACFSNGILSFSSSTEPTKEATQLLERFAKVFDSTYTRFLDLQKAEAQARESQIQLALERVRARAMAMQKSDELAETVSLVFKQLLGLGIRTEQIRTCGIVTFKDNEPWGEQWITETNGEIIPRSFMVPYDEAPAYKSIYKAWKDGEKFMVIHLEGKALKEHLGYLAKGTKVPTRDVVLPQQAREIFNHVLFFSQGCLFIITKEALHEYHDVFKRFGAVFQQSYTRFLDLQKAEAQAREAQIELALERVRARTMAMQKSDELQEIIKVVYEQLAHLNIPVEHAGFIMDYNTRDDMHIWLADKHYAPAEITVPYFDSPHWNGYNEAKEKGKDFFAIYSTFEEKNKFYQDLFKLIPGVTDETREYYFSCPGLAASTVLIENVGLYIENFSGTPFTDDENSTLMRFGKVFQQTYTRFLDLQKAEAQAREGQIEAALERVRSRTMSMHNSQDVGDTIVTLFDELTRLGFTTLRCSVDILNDTQVMEIWTAKPGENGKADLVIGHLDTALHPMLGAMYNAWKAHEPNFFYELTGDDQTRYLTALNEYAGYPIGDQIASMPARQFLNAFFFADGGILAWTAEPLHAEAPLILTRFASVFGQTYRRYLDLQRAEAQAREAQIEAALERVRSRTMGMQHSDELREVIQVIYEQFVHLGLDITSAGFTMDYKESDDWNLWMADAAYSFPNLLHIPYFDHPQWNGYNEARRKGLDAFANTLTQEQKNSFVEQVNKYVPNTEEIKNLIYSAPGYAISNVFLKNVALFIDRYSTVPFSEADNAILQRFGKVFEQTYTRFKDLEHAEQQARESQIQLGLERVRAKAMAMQTSEELNELIGTVFGELTKLDFVLTRCLIMIFDPETNSSRWWMANSEAPSEPMNYLVQYHKNAAYAAYLKAWKARDLKWRYALKGKVKRDWDNFLFVETELSLLPDFVIAGMKAPEQVLLSASFNNFGCLTLVSLEPLSDEHSDIMLRFAKVFDMSYTRFNDLQQAEAQAKEAQIQLALERVRARTMAMQKSEELAETAAVLFQQLLNLGISSERTFIGMPNDDTRKIELWGTEQGGNQMSMRFEYEADATYAFREIFKAWQEKRSELTVILKGKNLDEHVNYVRNVLHMPLLIGLVQQQRILYNAFFSKGLLMIVTPEIQSKETLDILGRFAAVFDGTYTRFLDLQKAEAQARESQIQLALERVRARTMAMQKSEELAETASVLFQQLLNLGISAERTIIGIPNEDTRKIEFWGTEQGGNQINTRFEYEADATYAFREIYKAWQEKRSELTVILKGKNLEEHVNYVRNVLHVPLLAGLVQKQRMLYNAFFSKGWLEIVTPETQSKETLDILQRFAGVFDGTYTRFLDLQQAEAQAREAKIEAALERVRAAAMAMHNSKDVGNATALVFSEFYKLGITTIRCGVCIIDGPAQQMEVWSASSSPDGMMNMGAGKLDMKAHPLWLYLLDAWQQKKASFSYELAGKELPDYYNAIKNAASYQISESDKPGEFFEINQFCNCYLFNEGCLFAFTQAPFSPEANQVLEKFASVFGLTYRRYLDLTKAEAQAREAQIEAALERVRSRTMAMHDSRGVADTSATMFQELVKLGVEPTVRCGVSIINSVNDLEVWTASLKNDGSITLNYGHLDMTAHPLFMHVFTEWQRKESSTTYELTGDAVRSYFQALNDAPGYPFQYPMDALPEKWGINAFFFREGCLFAFTSEPLSPEMSQVFKRFAGVFGQTHRRYLDLQKAEAQAREAKIEASLERVRSKTMAMHNSQDVSETVAVMFDELVKLGVETTSRLGIVIIDNTSHMEVWTAKSADA